MSETIRWRFGLLNDAGKDPAHAANVAGVPERPERSSARFFHRPFSGSILPWAFAPIFLMTGCHAMNNTATATDRIEPPALTKEVPLRFGGHNFEAYCFNVIGCNVIYNGRYQRKNAPDEISAPPPSPDYVQHWMGGEAGIRNFPPPAEVRWKSLDGVAHEAKVDISVIFKDELIWHKVPKTDMAFYKDALLSGTGDPDIFLEVNDRTINVYIGAFIPMRNEQRPGHKDSNYRQDNFLAWTHTY
jgi:hypothetical protein